MLAVAVQAGGGENADAGSITIFSWSQALIGLSVISGVIGAKFY